MSAKDTYHHGDLRRALMDEALRQIGEKGIDAVTLREVAAATGVSHAAPYHHFADKNALLVAIGMEGMALMDVEMERRQAAAGPDPTARLLAVGMGYVIFAVEHPEYYATMTKCELSDPQYLPPGEQSAGNTWERLLASVEECQTAGLLPPGDPVILAVYLWSLVHGLVELWRDGPLRYFPQAADGLEPLAEQVLGSATAAMRAKAEMEASR